MSVDIKKALSYVAKSSNARFYLHDKPISYDEAFSDTGMLPPIAKRADQLASLCLGYGIGVSFTDAEKSLAGSRVQFDDTTPTVLRLLCLIDIVSELIINSSSSDRVSLDELLYD